MKFPRRFLWIAAVAGSGVLAAQEPMIRDISDLLTVYEATPGDRWRKTRVETPAAWQAKRADIRRRVLDIMGRGGGYRGPVDLQKMSEEDAGAYRRAKVTYKGSEGDTITAWLLVPKRPGKRPAVLALHQTHAGGKNSPVGLEDKPYLHYGKELAERGFVVLAPDCITAGERVLAPGKPYVTEPFDRAHPEWSAMGKMLEDHRRGLDVLESLPEVDPARLAAVGHSLGGHNAFFLAAFDERVRATIASCGLSLLAGSQRPFAWSRTSWFVYFPKLASYLHAGIVPFDFHEVMSLVAPRPLFNYSASRDTIFPDAATIRAGGDQVREVYRVLGAEDRFVFRIGDGPHDFPAEIRREAYEWLERALSVR